MPDSYLPHLDVDPHLIWGARNKGINVERDYLKEIKTSLGINFEGKVREVSLGMRVRVSLATSLVSKPQLLLVDEAFSNIDNHRDFADTFRVLAAKAKVDVIFTTQYPEDSTQADHHYQLDSGKSTRLF